MAVPESVPDKNLCQRGSDRTIPAPPIMGASLANVVKNSRREIIRGYPPPKAVNSSKYLKLVTCYSSLFTNSFKYTRKSIGKSMGRIFS
jgi:hypothetical protein